MEFEAPPKTTHFKVIKQNATLTGTIGYKYQLRHYYLQDGEIEEVEQEETKDLDDEGLEAE